MGVERSNPQAALRTINAIDAAIDMARRFPRTAAATTPMTTSSASTAERLAGSYIIIYRYDATTLTVYRIMHQRQNIDTYSLIEF